MSDELDLGPVSEEFRTWMTEAGQLDPRHLGTRGVEIAKARKYKAATLTIHGDPDTGEVSHQRLKVICAPRHPQTGGYDFDNPESVWICEDGQVERLRAFLANELVGERFRIIDLDTPTGDLMRLLEGDDERATELVGALTTTLSPADLARVLQATASGQDAAELAVIARRRSVLDYLEELLEDPSTTETNLHRVLREEWWIFGARFIASLRTDLLPLDEHDLALLAADGSLHIVELKGPNIPALIRRPRQHWIVGTQVHEAAMQAANYVRTADEQGAAISTLLRTELNLDVDMRRAFASVVIGHPKYVTEHERRTEHSIDQALRTYNAHISRVEVLTYEQLISTARRSLTFTDAD